VFGRLASALFANSVDAEGAIRLIGFRLGSLEMPESRQSTLFEEE